MVMDGFVSSIAQWNVHMKSRYSTSAYSNWTIETMRIFSAKASFSSKKRRDNTLANADSKES